MFIETNQPVFSPDHKDSESGKDATKPTKPEQLVLKVRLNNSLHPEKYLDNPGRAIRDLSLMSELLDHDFSVRAKPQIISGQLHPSELLSRFNSLALFLPLAGTEKTDRMNFLQRYYEQSLEYPGTFPNGEALSLEEFQEFVKELDRKKIPRDSNSNQPGAWLFQILTLASQSRKNVNMTLQLKPYRFDIDKDTLSYNFTRKTEPLCQIRIGPGTSHVDFSGQQLVLFPQEQLSDPESKLYTRAGNRNPAIVLKNFVQSVNTAIGESNDGYCNFGFFWITDPKKRSKPNSAQP